MAVRHNWLYAYVITKKNSVAKPRKLDNMGIFPSRLKAARKAKRHTQRELAGLVGMDQGHISCLENGGKGVSMEHVQTLARELSVNVTHLLGEDFREDTGDYGATGERAAILSNYDAPHGLHELASNAGMIDTLKITDADCVVLKSIQLPDNVSMDGYVQLLITIRAFT